jgi:transposase
MSESMMTIKTVDHLGIVMGTMHRLGILDILESLFPKSEKEAISTAQGIAGMILNGLGFVNSPLSMTPHFFKDKAVESLFGPDVEASHFNHYKLGRCLDDIHDYGCEKLLSEISLSACQKEGISRKFNSLDTTSISVTGDYLSSGGEGEVTINHGYSKDHRPDLKQFMVELMVSQDGGVPLMIKSHNGNASDSKVFRDRANLMIDVFSKTQSLSILVGDCKLYDKQTAETALKHIKFITRIPKTIAEEGEVIDSALATQDWQTYANSTGNDIKYKEIAVHHSGIQQRWIVCHSQASETRARESIQKAVKKEAEKIDSQIKKINGKDYACEQDLKGAVDEIFKKAAYHTLTLMKTREHKEYGQRGRPSPKTSAKASTYTAEVQFTQDLKGIELAIQRRSCFVIGTNVIEAELISSEVVQGYKEQQWVERGNSFLKGHTFFADSIYLKSAKRIEALMVVMTLALLVYSIAQRALRNHLAEHEKTLPNQLKKEIDNPTLRWIFMMLSGIYEVTTVVMGQKTIVIHGVTELQKRIMFCFGQEVLAIYFPQKGKNNAKTS